MMEYQGYLGQVQFDAEANLFHGEVINVRDVITFQGRSVEELLQALKDSVEDYFEFCAELGKEPEKPFSGRVTIRLSPEQHRKVVLAAAQAGEALERWIAETLDRAAGTVQLGGMPA
jgi:predicted HicB family RNase H-like nuclease